MIEFPVNCFTFECYDNYQQLILTFLGSCWELPETLLESMVLSMEQYSRNGSSDDHGMPLAVYAYAWKDINFIATAS